MEGLSSWRDIILDRRIMLILIFGLVVRFVLIPITTSPFDVSAGWAAVIEETYAGDSLYEAELYKYPPVWGYILSFLGMIANLAGTNSFGDIFTNLYLGEEFTFGYGHLPSSGFNLLVKLPATMFDVFTAFAGYNLVKDITKDERKSCIAFAMWFLCPVVIMSSAVLGMFDSIMIFFMVEAIIFFRHGKYFHAGVFMSLSIMTKAFPAVLLPLLVVYILTDRRTGLRDRFKNIAYAAAGFILILSIVYLPVLLAGEFSNSLWFLSNRSSSYSETGFRIDIPSFTNIFFYMPVIIAILLVLYACMAYVKDNRENALLVSIVIALSVIFSFPFVAYTPTYGIVMIPAILILYSLKGNVAWIPWILTVFFVLHGIEHYHGTLFYVSTLADFINLESLWTSGSPFVYKLYQDCMSAAGFFLMVAMFYYYVLPRIIPAVKKMRGDVHGG